MGNSNNNGMEQKNLITLLDAYEGGIVIPKLQRDYSQGRKDAKASTVREAFLEDLFTAKVKSLDFIFGTRHEEEKCFIPIDGQQRLTTLFLLLLYKHKVLLAANDNLKSETEKNLLTRFTYDTRRAARDFFHAIVNESWTIVERPGTHTDDISYNLKNSNWFMDYWQYDPTVSACLNMLDAIHCKVSDQHSQYPNLESIKFFLYDMDAYNLNENLYLKMNSRGKPLTPFENIKASIEELLDGDQFKALPFPVCERAEDKSAHGYSFKDAWSFHIDRAWTNLFWQAYSVKTDKHFAQFICRFIAGAYQIYKTTEDKDETDKLMDGLCIELNDDSFVDFQSIKTAVTYTNVEALTNMAQALLGLSFNGWKDSTQSTWNEQIKELDTYNALTVIQGYLIGCNRPDKEHWVRFCWNMAENYVRNSSDNYIRFCQLLQKINNAMQDQTATLAQWMIDNAKYFDNEQYKEEVDKAQVIKKHGLVVQIIEAEGYAFFKGSIRFLFKDEEGKTSWDDFTEKFKQCQLLFTEQGLKETHWPLANQTILSYCHDWDEQLKRKFLFGTKADNWKSVLLNAHYACSVDKLLLGNGVNQAISKEESGPYHDILKLLSSTDEPWNMIKAYRDKYQLEWQGGVPCLWLSSYTRKTLRLREGKWENIIHRLSLIGEIRVDTKYEVLQIDGKEYFFNNISYVDFIYKNHLFRWQNWEWIDMYDGPTRLCEHNDKGLFCINEKAILSNEDLLAQLDKCIVSFQASNENPIQN